MFKPILNGVSPPVAVVQASLVLEMLTRICPAHQDALFIDAQIKYLSGDFNGASLILNKLLRLSELIFLKTVSSCIIYSETNFNFTDSIATDVHLLLAQVQISQEMLDEASQTLEAALSNNFSVILDNEIMEHNLDALYSVNRSAKIPNITYFYPKFKFPGKK